MKSEQQASAGQQVLTRVFKYQSPFLIHIQHYLQKQAVL